MFFGVLLGFAALGLFGAAFGDGQTETQDPVTDEGLRVAGSEQGDLLDSGSGNDDLSGEGGEDLMIGRDGADTLSGGDDADSLHGNDGNDDIRGDAGDDVIVGGDGADTLSGGTGNDRILSAGILDDAAYQASLDRASQTSDVALPRDYGPDTDTGDTVDAGEGDDHVTFGSEDEVTGGAGADLFETGDWVRPGAPATITDYDPSEDVIAYSFSGETPDITTQTTADGTATVLADGIPFLIVPNAGPDFAPAQIDLRVR